MRRERSGPAALIVVGDTTHLVGRLNLRESNPLDRLTLSTEF
ncbi:hypothetical protein [Deinococcus terrestris]|nr:hypothetical protein [Deinococcus terrestris]